MDNAEAILTVLVRWGRNHNPRINSDNLLDYTTDKAGEEFNTIFQTIRQAKERAEVGHFDSAIMYYLNALELIFDAKCYYERDPSKAFEEPETPNRSASE